MKTIITFKTVVFYFLLTISVYYHLRASLCFSIISWALAACKTSFLSAFMGEIFEKKKLCNLMIRSGFCAWPDNLVNCQSIIIFKMVFYCFASVTVKPTCMIWLSNTCYIWKHLRDVETSLLQIVQNDLYWSVWHTN